MCGESSALCGECFRFRLGLWRVWQQLAVLLEHGVASKAAELTIVVLDQKLRFRVAATRALGPPTLLATPVAAAATAPLTNLEAVLESH